MVDLRKGGNVDKPFVEEPVDINAASVDQLRSLEGLGFNRAEEIVAWRERHGPFETVDDLQRLPDFTPDVVAALRHRLKV